MRHPPTEVLRLSKTTGEPIVHGPFRQARGHQHPDLYCVGLAWLAIVFAWPG